MGFRFAHLTGWLLLAGMAMTLARVPEAQAAGRRPGQPILFSDADDSTVSSNMPSLAPKPPSSLDFANAIQSPGANLGAASQTGQLPEPAPPAISAAQIQQMQRRQDKQKNWALLTPEQILGLSSPEKVLGLQERNAAGQPKNESVMAQYSERQDRLRTRTNNVNFGLVGLTPRRDFAGDLAPQVNSATWVPAAGRPENPTLKDQFLNGAQDDRAANSQAPASGWSKSFNLPAQPEPTPEHEAAMEQFRKLLQPHSPPGDTVKSSSLGSPVFGPASTAPAPESSAMTPVGASYTPLSSGITVPNGVTPVPDCYQRAAATASHQPGDRRRRRGCRPGRNWA